MSTSKMPDKLPPQPPCNIQLGHTVALTAVSLEEAYERLIRLEAIEAVAKLSSVAQRCDVGPVEYSSEQTDLLSLKTPYNVDFSSTTDGPHLRRAKFFLLEHLDYKIMSVDAHIFGSQTELARPDFEKGIITLLYASYEQKKKIWVRKIRTLSRLPDKNGHSAVKVAETLEITSPKVLRPIVKRSARKAHKRHMLQYARLFDGDKVTVTLLESSRKK